MNLASIKQETGTMPPQNESDVRHNPCRLALPAAPLPNKQPLQKLLQQATTNTHCNEAAFSISTICDR